MTLQPFYSAFSTAMTLYDIDITSEDFEEIALIAWEKIGNRHTRLYRFIGDTKNSTLDLPCNVSVIESVHIPMEDAQMTSNLSNIPQFQNLFIENYIENLKELNDPIYTSGKLVKYREGNGVLYFSRDYKGVTVVYHGVIVDDDGLPLISSKEIHAIAAYVSYAILYKKGLQLRDKSYIELSQLAKGEWLRTCNSARIPEHFSQNDMDAILDVKVRWDRKGYGKSMKPIL